MLFCSTLTTATLLHIMEHSSREVHLAKMTSCGLYLSSVVPAPLLTWFGLPSRTHWERSGLHIFVARSCVAWHICMLTELFIATLKVKMFCWLTMLKSNWVRIIISLRKTVVAYSFLKLYAVFQKVPALQSWISFLVAVAVIVSM